MIRSAVCSLGRAMNICAGLNDYPRYSAGRVAPVIVIAKLSRSGLRYEVMAEPNHED
jgi:hypothetical protein